MIRHVHQDPHGWRGVVIAAGLNAGTMPLDLLLARGVPDMPAWPALGSSAIGFLIVAVLLLRRSRSSPRLTSTAFLINSLVILIALWVTSSAWAATGHWVPFQANKLGALAVAILAPDVVTGLICIAGFVGMVLVKSQMLAPDIRERFPVAEPWTIVIYGLFGAALLVYRLHGLSLERRMLHAKSETAAAERTARAFLAIRDLTNTPLQTIELATELIRKRHPDLAPVLLRIDRSVDRLFRLNQTFAAYDAHLKWTHDEVSPDRTLLPGRDPTR